MELRPSQQDVAPSGPPPDLGARIAHLRKMLGLRQNMLAERAGLRSQRLSDIERGVHEPRVDELARLARALGASLDELVFGAPQRTPLTSLAARLEAMMPAADLAALTVHLEVLLAGYAVRQASHS
jgi:transcriptional regulator with XRE-family HTH domain